MFAIFFFRNRTDASHGTKLNPKKKHKRHLRSCSRHYTTVYRVSNVIYTSAYLHIIRFSFIVYGLNLMTLTITRYLFISRLGVYTYKLEMYIIYSLKGRGPLTVSYRQAICIIFYYYYFKHVRCTYSI